MEHSDTEPFTDPENRHPLTLVCAPAGYGKSTLVAQWIEKTEVVAGRLSNDFDRIDKPFILVLDDFQRSRDSQVHEVLNRVLEYPPRGMHLIIATRRNPSLALPALRGRHIMREVRLCDLQFTREQTAQFLERASHKLLKAKTVQMIHEETEGWPVALRLAALAR